MEKTQRWLARHPPALLRRARQPNVVTWVEDNGNTVQFSLLPGHIWGHFNAVPGAPIDGELIRNFGINRRWGETTRSVITSTGAVVDQNNSCTGNFGHCFEHNSDTYKGHGGSPIMRLSDHSVYGVQNGAQFAVWDKGEQDDPCGTADPWSTENRASKIASDIFQITGATLRRSGAPVPAGLADVLARHLPAEHSRQRDRRVHRQDHRDRVRAARRDRQCRLAYGSGHGSMEPER